MRAFKKYCLLTFLVLLTLNSLTGCSYFFYVKPTGNLNENVVFKFYKSSDDTKQKKYAVLDFTVQEQKANSNWIVVWDVKGEESLDTIEYGKKYKGLSELTPAKPLEKKVRYRALVSASTWPDPGVGNSGVNFYFDDTGKLIEGDLTR